MFPTTHGEFDKFSSYATSPAMYTAKPCYILDSYIIMTRLSLLRTIIVYNYVKISAASLSALYFYPYWRWPLAHIYLYGYGYRRLVHIPLQSLG